MIECDPAACVEIAHAQREAIRATLPALVGGSVLVWAYGQRKASQRREENV